MKIAFLIFLASEVPHSLLTLASPTTTKLPMVNYDSAFDPTTADNFHTVNHGDDDVVVALLEEEDEKATAGAIRMESEETMHERQLDKVYHDDEVSDNSTIEVDVPSPGHEMEDGRIIHGFYPTVGLFAPSARIFPTFGSIQFV